MLVNQPRGGTANAAPLTPKNLRRVGACEGSFDISAFPLFTAKFSV
jgi:hypothetical protein